MNEVDLEEGQILAQSLSDLKRRYYQLELIKSFETLGKTTADYLVGNGSKTTPRGQALDRALDATGRAVELVDRLYENHLRRQLEADTERAQELEEKDATSVGTGTATDKTERLTG